MTVGRNLGVYIWMTLSYNFYFGWEKDEWMDGWMNWKREGKITEGSFLNVSGVWYNINWEKPQRKKIYIMEAFVLLAIFFGTIIQREGRALSMGWGVFPITLKGNKLMENHLPLVPSGVSCGPSRPSSSGKVSPSHRQAEDKLWDRAGL